MKKIILIIALCILVIATLFVGLNFVKAPENVVVTNFEECAKAKGAIMESYPRQCNYKGQTFAEFVTTTFSGALTKFKPTKRVAITKIHKAIIKIIFFIIMNDYIKTKFFLFYIL